MRTKSPAIHAAVLEKKPISPASVSKKRLAIHEAGHAVMAWICGIEIQEASIRPLDHIPKSVGYCRVENIDWDESKSNWVDEDEATGDMLQCLAGAVAEHIRFGGTRFSAALGALGSEHSDYAHIEKGLRAMEWLKPDEKHITYKIENQLWLECRRRLLKHWAAVEAVASRLEDGDPVAGDEIVEICEDCQALANLKAVDAARVNYGCESILRNARK